MVRELNTSPLFQKERGDFTASVQNAILRGELISYFVYFCLLTGIKEKNSNEKTTGDIVFHVHAAGHRRQ
jgi:hypothetical protein